MGRPCRRKRSATPVSSGASGPTTVRSTPSRSDKCQHFGGGRRGRRVGSGPASAVPGLPGAVRTSVTSGSLDRRQARACSRPPLPRISTFTGRFFHEEKVPTAPGLRHLLACYSTVFPGSDFLSGGQSPAGRGCRALAEVKIQEGESIESALRRFKRKVQQEDIIKDIKKHSFYLKPGDKRRAKQALARKRSRKKQRRDVE